MHRDRPFRIRRLRAFHRVPEDAVELIFRTFVRLRQRQARRRVGVLAQQQVRDLLRVRIHLVERHVVREGGEGREVRLVGEAVEHRSGARIELVHRRQAEDQLHRPQQARLVVLRAHHFAALRVRADHVTRRAITAHMIPAGLRIVFDGEDARLLPKLALAERLDDLAEREVVVGDLRGGRGRAGLRAAGVIVRQTDENEVRHLALLLELAEVLDELRGAEDIRHIHVPADGVRVQMRTQRFDRGPAAEVDVRRAVDELAIVIQELWFALHRFVLPRLHRDGELAVVPHRLAMREHVVPDEAARRVRDRVHIAVLHAVGIAAREAGERLLHVIRRDAGVRPLMPVRAEDAGAIRVIQQHEVAHHLVLIRGDVFAEDAERRIAVALFQRAEDLIVGAVLLDDIDDVLEHARLAAALRHRACGLAGSRW